MDGRIATAEVDIDALPDDVWFALTDPAAIRRYMFGTTVASDWRVGSPITWTGEYEGRPYEDHGEVLEASPGRLLRYTHVSPARDGRPDNVHEVCIALEGVDEVGTRVTLSQDGNDGEDACRHAARQWTKMLDGLKLLVEQKRRSPL